MESKINDSRQLLSDIKFHSDYGRYDYEKERYETWEEGVERVMDMHRKKYEDKLSDKLDGYIKKAEQIYKDKRVLGSQRALQFGGDQLLKHEAKMYNCLSSYADRPHFFQDFFYFLLCGCGVGFSVQDRHISQLPKVEKRSKRTRTYIAEDSIEGWSSCIGVLLSSYFEGGGTMPEYNGYTIHFDLSNIRKKGAFISGGFKAPGPEPLRESLRLIEELIEEAIADRGGQEAKLESIEVYDICMHIADAVISGGVRRSATICIFDKDDEDMMNAKTFENFNLDPSNPKNPQRARSNNSAILLRDEVTFEEFSNLYEKTKQFGEPGFVFADDLDVMFNPCVEISKYPQTLEGESGFQGCNLVEINGAVAKTEEEFYEACRAAAILGTLQAGYTDFRYVQDTCQEIFEGEALLGCSITGMAMNPDITFDPEVQRKGAQIIKEVNAEIAEIIGINKSARSTCVKPSGNSSVILKCSSGIHAEHAKRYFRLMQMNKENESLRFVKRNNPCLVEESVYSRDKADDVIYVPIENDDKTLIKDDYTGTDFLELVKLTQANWVEEGTRPELCRIPALRHNVSNTCVVGDDEWDEVAEYIYENREYFTGISLLSDSGDKDFEQAPNTSVAASVEVLTDKYGDGAIFSSGLIVDALKAFNGNLWSACSAIGVEFEETSETAMKRDWVRRAKQFADRYFNGDIKEMTYCLKDVHLYHKWNEIQFKFDEIDWSEFDAVPEYTDVDTMGAIACHGGACEIL